MSDGSCGAAEAASAPGRGDEKGANAQAGSARASGAPADQQERRESVLEKARRLAQGLSTAAGEQPVDSAVERAQQALREQSARERSGAARPAPPASSQIPVHGGAAIESGQVAQRERQLAAAVDRASGAARAAAVRIGAGAEGQAAAPRAALAPARPATGDMELVHQAVLNANAKALAWLAASLA